MQRNELNVILIALAIIFFVTIITIIVVQTTFSSNFFGVINPNAITPVFGPAPTADVLALGDSGTLTLKSATIGFEIDYPASWRKIESPLQVAISPSTTGLEPNQRREVAVLVGIPEDGNADSAAILTNLVTDFRPTSLKQAQMEFGGTRWSTAHVQFRPTAQGGFMQAILGATTQNEVGYYLVAMAPAGQWNSLEPVFQRMFNSFRFTQQAVLRPTDATPPPTPTPGPSPTPFAGGLLISEVLFDPLGSEPGEEWIELYNLSPGTITLEHFKIGDEESLGGSEGMYAFPAGASLPAGQLVVIANRTDAFEAIHGFKPDYEFNDSDPAVPDMVKHINWSGGSVSLSNGGDDVLLLDFFDQVIDAVSWGSST
ncbi:MAG: lamin tail domain-containing protein, partial [Anaerolineae bacterium]|nr:lamin tail domain-containing protein [Anaerolineae bacterium]